MNTNLELAEVKAGLAVLATNDPKSSPDHQVPSALYSASAYLAAIAMTLLRERAGHLNVVRIELPGLNLDELALLPFDPALERFCQQLIVGIEAQLA